MIIVCQSRREDLKKVCFFVAFSLFICFFRLNIAEETQCCKNNETAIRQDSCNGKDVATCISCTNRVGYAKNKIVEDEAFSNILFFHTYYCFDDLLIHSDGTETKFISTVRIAWKFRPQMARIYIQSDSDTSDNNVIVY